MQKKRLEFVDSAKGIAILLLLFSHTGPGNIVNSIITAFHMPIFFIISGILISYKYGDSITAINIFKAIIKRTKQLFVPYYIFGLMLLVFFALLGYISTGQFSYKEHLLSLLTFRGIGSLWFIPIYFFAEFLLLSTLLFIKRKTSKTFIAAASVVLLMSYFYLQENPQSQFLCLLLKTYVAYTFSLIGYLFHSTRHLYNRILAAPLYITIMLLTPFVICSLFNGTVGIGALSFNNPFIFYINAIGISILFFSLMNTCTKPHINHCLSFFGQNSIVILCTNNLIIEVCRLLDYKIFGNILISWGLYGNIIFTIILIAIEIPIIILTKKTKLSILFGK